MSIYTPDVIKDIIYKYLHELKMTDLMLELLSKARMCARCDEIKIVNKKINPYRCHCSEPICTNCYEDDLLYFQDENIKNINIRCLCCLEYDDWDEMTDDYDSIDEDAVWQEMYGITCISEIY